MLAWTPHDSLWVPLPQDDPRRQLWKPEQVEIYDSYTWRNKTRNTPADFARMTTPEWIDFPHITYISNIIADFINDRLIAPNGKPAKRLFLTMPPRHGKSYLLSHHVPAWYLTMFPNRHVILTTYEATFAESWGGKVRDLIQTHGAKYGLEVSQSSQAKGRWSLAKPYLGGMITAGMGGPITGMGGGLLIGDDWVKNSDEANSEVWREKSWDWFNTTFKTRAQKDLQDPNSPPPKMLLLMTRWHDDDPMGRLLAKQDAGQGGDLVVIHLPAIAVENDVLGREPGEALCPKIMSADELQDLKAEDPRSFQCLYQGDPTPDDGGLFSKSHFRRWMPSPDGSAYVLQTPEGTHIPVRREDCRHYITVDLAISEKNHADYSVFSLWAATPDKDLLLVSRFRDRIPESDHLPSLLRFYEEAEASGVRVRLVGIEKQSYGLSLIRNGKRDTHMPIRALEADKDKYSRAIPASSHTKAGKVYLPEHAEWVEEFMGECTGFPYGAHDDQVDTFAYAVEVQRTLFGLIKARSEPDTSQDRTIENHVAKIAARNAKKRRQKRARGLL